MSERIPGTHVMFERRWPFWYWRVEHIDERGVRYDGAHWGKTLTRKRAMKKANRSRRRYDGE